MEPNGYAYTAEPTRNPFRYALAVWRLIRSEAGETTDEAAIVEMGFARSRLGRRFARWGETIATLESDPRTAPALEARSSSGPIDLGSLQSLPEGTLGRAFADHCRTRELNPNLVHIPPTDEVGWMLNHLFQYHDVWHVVTGSETDEPGEVGLGGFYMAQLGSPRFFGFMLSLLLMRQVMRGGNLDAMMAATSEGYRAGQRAEPLFGTDWDTLWAKPLDEVRARFGIESTAHAGERDLAALSGAVAMEIAG